MISGAAGEFFGPILTGELWLVTLLLTGATALRLRRCSRITPGDPVRQRIGTTADIIISFVFLAFAAAASWSTGRPVFGPAVAVPGSLVTQFAFFGLDPAGRRLVEPILLLLLGAIFFKAVSSSADHAGKRTILFEAWIVLFTAESLEGLLNVRYPQLAGPAAITMIDGIRLVLLQGILIATVIDGLVWSFADHGPPIPGRNVFSGAVRRMTACYLTALLFCGVISTIARGRPEPLKVGAHYYSWFPENWSHGYFWKELRPATGPLAGEYRSGDPAVISQQISWARGAGIDFFVLDWWPSRRSQRNAALQTFNSKPSAADFSFAVQIETLDLKDARDRRVRGEARDLIVLTPQRIKRLRRTVEFLAQEMMTQPQYLRIEGRPVLFFYASRHLVGPVGQVFSDLRRDIRQRFGFDLFIIGDEVYEHVVADSGRHGPLLLPHFEPNWDRIAAFDAITCYNPYVAERSDLAGSPGTAAFLKYGAELYARYFGVARSMGIPFFPGILPGYNDRGVRAKENHHVVPREIGFSGTESFFAEALREWGEPFLDPIRPVLLITSWNEWNEGTNIEPTAPSPPTNDDSSGEARAYTGGEFFSGTGCRALEELELWIRKRAGID